VHNEVVIGVWHPLEFTEEAPTEEFTRGLNLFHLKSLFYSLLVGFQELIRSQSVR
jgi:hypothetical protein